MTREPSKRGVATTARLLLVAAAACLAGCAGLSQQAQIPASGVNGPNGGSEETIYYDNAGHAHFHA